MFYIYILIDHSEYWTLLILFSAVCDLLPIIGSLLFLTPVGIYGFRAGLKFNPI